MSPLLVVEDLHAGYGTTEVVRGLSFSVDAGEVVALLGPNGAGKTTTLLTVAGLLPALSGSVTMLGTRVDARAPHRNAHAGLAFVTEDRSLFPQLTVRENLRLGARDRGAAAEMLEILPELDALQSRKAAWLSGGEQQMLAIARALATRPKLLLVDEMSLGLAPVIVERLAPVIRRAADDFGIGVVLVEQHLRVALEIADRGIVLRHGEVCAAGSAAALADQREVLHASYLGAVPTPTR